MAKLSFVCPCWNSIAVLPRLLSSFASLQGDVEIVFVLDPSTDGSKELLQEASSKDPRVVLVANEERKGIVPCRMLGIARASGEYVGFVDADDWLSEDFATTMLSALEKSGADAVDCSFYIHKTVEKGMRYPFRFASGTFSSAKIERKLLADASMRGFLWTKVFRKETLLDKPAILLPRNHLFEDMAYCFSCFDKCEKVTMIRKPLYHYYKGMGDSATTKPNPRRALDHLECFACLRAYADINKNEDLVRAVRSSKWRMNLSLAYDRKLSKKAGMSKEEDKAIRKALKLVTGKKPLPLEGQIYSDCVKASLVL